MNVSDTEIARGILEGAGHEAAASEADADGNESRRERMKEEWMKEGRTVECICFRRAKEKNICHS